MRIGIVGGTGKEGVGLGQRWAQAGHDVIIGSRAPGRAPRRRTWPRAGAAWKASPTATRPRPPTSSS